jgi:hypothetical protein
MTGNGFTDHQAQPGPSAFRVRNQVYIGSSMGVPSQNGIGEERANRASGTDWQSVVYVPVCLQGRSDQCGD